MEADPAGSRVTTSPFVKVFQLIGVPAAAHLVNFVVITAAASSMNCNLIPVQPDDVFAGARRLRATTSR